MSLRLRLNLLITLLFLILFVISSFYIIANSRAAVQREVESTARLALQLIQIAISTAELESDANKQMQLLDSLTKLEETRHLHIEISNAEEVFYPLDIGSKPAESNAPGWFVGLVQPPPTELRRWLYNPTIPPTGIIVRADPYDEIDENWEEVKSLLILLFVFICLLNISTALAGIQRGNYKAELSEFSLPELNDLSQRFNHMTRVLQKSKAENQLLTQRSLQIQEEERRHLAQELHDELGQTITAIKAVAVAISNDSQQDRDQTKANVRTIVNYSDHMYSVAKNMMHRLRPSILDEFGLVKALQHMVDDWNSRQDDVFCHFEFSDVPEDLEEPVKISLFRITQESLTNVLKHAAATEMHIKLEHIRPNVKELIHLSIIDDGIGIDMNNLKPGLGLLGMRERVDMLEGVFSMSTSINKGLNIDIEIPLQQ